MGVTLSAYSAKRAQRHGQQRACNVHLRCPRPDTFSVAILKPAGIAKRSLSFVVHVLFEMVLEARIRMNPFSISSCLL